MKRDQAWYERHQKRVDEWRKTAREWNGHKDTSGLGNVEFVTVTGGGVESRHALDPRAAETGLPARVDAARAGVASGPPTPLYPLVTLCRSMKLPEPVPEYCFAKSIGRRWRADYCWPAHMLILEVNGGVWIQGRHTRGDGAIKDMEKLSEAAIMGYRVLYCTPEQMHNGVALDRIIRALTDRAAA